MSRRTLYLLVVFAILVGIQPRAFGQGGFDDPRVMLQGFYWESYRHGHPEKPEWNNFGDKRWYEIIQNKADEIRDAKIDLIWLPPPSFAGDHSAGYNPRELFKFENSYGTEAQHRAALKALLEAGVEPLADIVINHRDGSSDWADFKNPDWDTTTICKDDEVFTRGPMSYRNAPRGQSEGGARYRDNFYSYGDFRDIDHSSEVVRRDILKYLKSLRTFGYRGWRYDMVHGYHAKYLALYNKHSNPTFSVGEYDWDKHAQQRGWIYETATTPNDLRTASSVFDFTTQFTLKDNKGNYTALFGLGNGLGMMGDNTDGLPWKCRSVTFLENHDSGYRTNDDGTPQKDHERDNFLNDWQVEQGYAYTLTHPGVPCVYWKHYFDWGRDLRERIKFLINARKVAGVHSGSRLHTQDNARARGVYAAFVEGKNGKLYVRIGGSDNEWNPSQSSYQDYCEYAAGTGWKVWVALPDNPAMKIAPQATGLGVLTFQKPTDISIPDSMVNDLNP